jgi:hypothetical protein
MPDSARHVGEIRKPSHIANLTVEASITILWPEGVPIDEGELESIAANAVRQRWQRDVGPVGKIIWAECSSDCSDNDVTIDEIYEA